MNEQGFTSGRPLSSVLLGFRNVDREAKDAILVSLSSPSVLVTISFLFLLATPGLNWGRWELVS